MDSAIKSLTCEKCLNAKVRGLTFAMRISSAEIYVCLKCAMQHVPMLKRSIATALVVGTILVMLNQGDLIFSGQGTLALDSRYGIHQLKGLGDIVSVRASQYRQWNALGIGYDMMLATRLRPVRGVGACFLPPKTGTEALSSTARVQSMRSAACAQGIPSGCAPRLPTGANL